MINIKGRKISIIGGAGFIGHNLALTLKQLGADVSVVDGLNVNNFLSFHDTRSHLDNRLQYIDFLNERMHRLIASDIPVYVEDARDYARLSVTLGKIKPQVIVLLAAVAHADRSNKNPYSTFDHSLHSLENALDVLRDDLEHFIYFSSSMVYGNFPDGFVTETTTCNPLGIYGSLKYAGEKMVISYNQVFKMPFTIVRPSALYGPRCVSRRVLQIFIENAIKGKEIVINGTGDDRIDFTYIDDLISGVINVIENEESKGQIFNLTYGASRSINDVIQCLGKRFSKLNVKYIPKDALTPSRGTLSVEKAKQLIGYNPQNPIEKGLNKYVDWYESFFSSK